MSNELKRHEGAFVLCILDPLPYDFKKDTSHLLLREFFTRGYRIYYATPDSLFWDRDRLKTRASQVRVLPAAPYFHFHKEEILDLNRFALILVRKDPPVDTAYLSMTQLLSMVSRKIPVINAPEALRDWNEKLIILNFPQWIPTTLVTTRREDAEDFCHKVGPCVFKPLNGFAGKGVRVLRDAQDVSWKETGPVLIQSYLPEISQGEKRVFLIQGRPKGALLKIPPPENFLANPDHGARLAPTQLTKKEEELCLEVGSFLKKNGIFFAGLDLIGEKLTEINMTSPGLLWEWNEVDNTHHETEIVDAFVENFL